MAYDSTDFVVEVDEVTRILKDARNIIQNGWCIGYVAKDKDGVWTGITSDDATSFCSIGAIARAVGTNVVYDDRITMASIRLKKQIDMDSSIEHTISTYNDSHTKEEVLAIFDRAIAQGTK